ncbi:DNA replication protein DnaD, partial [Lactobacillus salivarius]|nr:DNA replication protein DnaD [Ligilactobacillus salivarius]
MDSTLREFLRQGNTVISNLVLKNYKKLGMTDT